MPTTNHVVRIVLGHTVTIDDTSAVASRSRSTSAFSPTVTTRLKVTNLEVMAGEMGMGTRGILEVGTTAAPIGINVTAEIVIADSPLGGSVPDPEQFGTGINVFGKVSMHGSVRTPTFLRLATEPRVGHTTLTLSAAVSGWKVGDRIVLPDTRHIKESEVTGGGWVNAVNQWEERTVQAISADRAAHAQHRLAVRPPGSPGFRRLGLPAARGERDQERRDSFGEPLGTRGTCEHPPGRVDLGTSCSRTSDARRICP